MAGTRMRFRLTEIDQTNNPPLSSNQAYFLAPDDVKNRLIVRCDPSKIDLTRNNHNQHNTTVFCQRLTPISTTKTQTTQQSNVTVVSIVLFRERSALTMAKRSISGWLLHRFRSVVANTTKKAANERRRNRDQERSYRRNKHHHRLQEPTISLQQSFHSQIQVGWCVGCVTRLYAIVVFVCRCCCRCCVAVID